MDIIEYDNVPYIIREPSVEDKIIGKYKYDQAYTYFLSHGAFTDDEINMILEERDIWSKKDDEELSKLKTELSNTDNELDRQLDSIKLHILNLQKDKIQKRINELEHNKLSLNNKSVEYLSKIEEYKYYTFVGTYNIDNVRVWDNWKDFQEAEEHLVYGIINQFFFNDLLTETNIRLLARSEPWRSVWLTTKKSGNIFGKPAYQLTDTQRILVSWSTMYDSIYENPDAPPDDVIENDNLLDQWIKQQSNERKKKIKEKYKGPTARSFSMNSKISNSQEIGIVVNSVEDLKKVYDLNDEGSKRLVKQRFEQINKEGIVKEGHLKDVNLDIQMRKNRLETEAVKKRRK